MARYTTINTENQSFCYLLWTSILKMFSLFPPWTSQGIVKLALECSGWGYITVFPGGGVGCLCPGTSSTFSFGWGWYCFIRLLHWPLRAGTGTDVNGPLRARTRTLHSGTTFWAICLAHSCPLTSRYSLHPTGEFYCSVALYKNN